MLLLRRLRDKITKDKMENKIPKKNISKSKELVNQKIPLEPPEKQDLEPS